MIAPAASAVILCGGRSTRMGCDKAAMRFGNETMLDRVVRIVRSELEDVVVAVGPAADAPVGARIARDDSPDAGPLRALLGALDHVNHDTVFVVACDTPLLDPGVIRLLLDASRGWEACVPVVDDVKMTACAVYARTAVQREAAALERAGAASLHALAARLRTRFLQPDDLRAVDPRLLSFQPCNTPAEFRRLLSLAGLDA